LLEENRNEYEQLKSTLSYHFLLSPSKIFNLENYEESLIDNKQKSQKDSKKIQKLKVIFFKKSKIFFQKEDLAALSNEYQKSMNFRKCIFFIEYFFNFVLFKLVSFLKNISDCSQK